MRGRGAAKPGDSLRGLLRGALISIDDADGSATLGKADGNCLADAAGSACHHGHFIVQTKSAHSEHPLAADENAWIAASTFVFGQAHSVNNWNSRLII
jgi:hypothetical protein